jgi:hypothetical protein
VFARQAFDHLLHTDNSGKHFKRQTVSVTVDVYEMAHILYWHFSLCLPSEYHTGGFVCFICMLSYNCSECSVATSEMCRIAFPAFYSSLTPAPMSVCPHCQLICFFPFLFIKRNLLFFL